MTGLVCEVAGTRQGETAAITSVLTVPLPRPWERAWGGVSIQAAATDSFSVTGLQLHHKTNRGQENSPLSLSLSPVPRSAGFFFLPDGLRKEAAKQNARASDKRRDIDRNWREKDKKQRDKT